MRFTAAGMQVVIEPGKTGRVTDYGFAGGPNLLWKLQLPPDSGFVNWGGDKTFVGPHAIWGQFSSSLWPPLAGWDGGKHETVSVGSLKAETRGTAWAGMGIRVDRVCELDPSTGWFVIHHMIEKIAGNPLECCVWDVTQLAAPDEVFFILAPNADTDHSPGFLWLSDISPRAQIKRIRPDVIRVRPAPGVVYKIGIPGTTHRVIARFNDTLMIMESDGPNAATTQPTSFDHRTDCCPVEFYNHPSQTDRYVEVEFLSPPSKLSVGQTAKLTTRWRLMRLPGSCDDGTVLRLASLPVIPPR